MKAEFLHVGLTVKDLKRTIDFYQTYFGFKLEMTGVFDEQFIRGHNVLYRLVDGEYSDFCFLKSANGIVLEVFQFHPQKEAQEVEWARPGYTHICFWVEDIFAVYERLKADGVKIFFEPDVRQSPEEHWMFLQDPDGNLIELQD